MAQKIEDKVEIIETARFKSTGATAVMAFPGVGMVGNIALTHMIDKLGLKEVGHIDSPETPRVVLIHKNRPAYPIRLYAGQDLVIILSELPVLAHATDELNDAIAGWLKKKKVKRLLILGGFPNPKRASIKKPEIYGIPSDKGSEAVIKKLKLKPIKEGAVFGEQGMFLLKAMEEGIPALYLMSDSFLAFPDPASAASMIQVLNKILGKKVETKQLLLKAAARADSRNRRRSRMSPPCTGDLSAVRSTSDFAALQNGRKVCPQSRSALSRRRFRPKSIYKPIT